LLALGCGDGLALVDGRDFDPWMDAEEALVRDDVFDRLVEIGVLRATRAS